MITSSARSRLRHVSTGARQARMDSTAAVATINARAAEMVAGPRPDWVETPTQVLGLADRGVALWVETKPAPGVQRVIGLDELAAIDQRQILTCTRLTFLARNRRLRVHYKALAGHELDRALAAVRAAASGYPLAVPEEPPPPMLPARAHMTYSLAVRLRPCDPALLRFAGAPDQGKDVGGTLVALTPGELVIVRDPDRDSPEDAPVCGHDLLHVMRRRLEGDERCGALTSARRSHTRWRWSSDACATSPRPRSTYT
jgi:hypothetical protein